MTTLLLGPERASGSHKQAAPNLLVAMPDAMSVNAGYALS
jgi:hypothetical protein